MTIDRAEARRTIESLNAVGSPVERGVRPYATSVTWRNDEGGSWQQWHDDEDPMPAEWDDRPPDEVVHVYSADQVKAMLRAERARWNDAVMLELDCNGQAEAIILSATDSPEARAATILSIGPNL
jgi:hypothetical protein